MERLYKPLITLYRINYKIFNSKDDAVLYCKMNPDICTLKDLETITLCRTSHEFWIWATPNARTIMTIETLKNKNTYYLSYSTDIPPYALDLTLGILEETNFNQNIYKEPCNEIHPYEDFLLWQNLIDTLLQKGYHIRDGVSPFQLYEHNSKFFTTKQELNEYFSKNPCDHTDYRTINFYPSATNDVKDIVIVEDVYAENRVDRIHFITQIDNQENYQFSSYKYPISGLNDSYIKKMNETPLEWDNCEGSFEDVSYKKSFSGMCLSFNQQVAESIFKASKNHHSLVTVSPISPTSNHLFFYNGQFYNNFNTIFEKCKKDKKTLNESVRVYEYSRDVSENGAIKTYMYGDNVADCFAYYDENSYARLGINGEGEIRSKEILDDSLEEIQQVFYYFMTKGLTPTHTTDSINNYFKNLGNNQKLSSLKKVLIIQK